MAASSDRICLIPARGGSKRLPRKNVLPFRGKPMLLWSIECALESELFEDVHVSSEDEEIGELAERSGAVWVRRSSQLAGDDVEVDEVCIDFLEREEAAGRRYETLVILYAAAPLRSVSDIRDVVARVEADGADFAMTVADYPFSPFEALEIRDDGHAELMWPDLANRSRVERPNVKVDVGSTYAARVSAYRAVKTLYGPNLRIVEVPPERGVDIDTTADLAIAEYYASRTGQGSPC